MDTVGQEYSKSPYKLAFERYKKMRKEQIIRRNNIYQIAKNKFNIFSRYPKDLSSLMFEYCYGKKINNDEKISFKKYLLKPHHKKSGKVKKQFKKNLIRLCIFMKQKNIFRKFKIYKFNDTDTPYEFYEKYYKKAKSKQEAFLIEIILKSSDDDLLDAVFQDRKYIFGTCIKEASVLYSENLAGKVNKNNYYQVQISRLKKWKPSTFFTLNDVYHYLTKNIIDF